MSTPISDEATTTASEATASKKSLPALYCDLTKARLTSLVLLTTFVGFFIGSSTTIDWLVLLWTLIGTALSAASASALNQLMEATLDSRMQRTQERPIPSGAMGRVHAFIAGMLMGYVGLAILALLVNLLASGLALATIVLYVLVYTPLKTRSTLNTLIGAICGALPPLIGWVAATGTLSGGGWLLAAILFVWQLPHFFALAWMYREDYRRGGFKMLPVVDETGRLTSETIVITSLCLIPLGLLVCAAGLAGEIFAIGAVLLGGWFSYRGMQLYRRRTDENAKRVFMASLLYLTVLLVLLVIDRHPYSPLDAFVAQQRDAPTASFETAHPDIITNPSAQ
ncbi:MAG: heme o synthase [Phycisphaerales bacterium]|nr:heme o synthase [Phycisphaerales bacterium]